nr:hypothetical transcript [Hymenolepis microstoma]
MDVHVTTVLDVIAAIVDTVDQSDNVKCIGTKDVDMIYASYTLRKQLSKTQNMKAGQPLSLQTCQPAVLSFLLRIGSNL